ncbi:MAG: SDR family oxidoreductase [Phenylobacterium sp.]|uniref:SDR family NAD(P)-dependent oxidoreductase n=1 Tax=Phenylobacterium sp. TaxID=1871053 RepID=UPI002732851E|nr:SDR family oxidoreductase [Phenylobacterium sp.]MDP3749383.1 SDR family oxidoreductase [Phenylobacterium sp.]
MSQPFNLRGRAMLVTGSTRGIGRALALGLAAQGADVAIHGRRGDGGEEVAAEARALGARAEVLMADLGDPDACLALAQGAIAAFGAIDGLVLNASMEIRQDWMAATPADIDLQLAVNLRSTLLLCQALTPPMMARGWGRVISIGSIQEVRPNPACLVYAASKAAQANVVANLARQLGPHGVTVNNLAPGAIATDRNAAVLADPAYRRKVEDQIPVGRVGDPIDCVGACVLLASEAGGYINGATLRVDGGWSL